MEDRYVVMTSIDGRYVACREYQTESLKMAQQVFYSDTLRICSTYVSTDGVIYQNDRPIIPGCYVVELFDKEEDRLLQRSEIVYYDPEGVEG